MLEFIQSHLTIISLVLFWVASAAIGSLPAPTATSSAFYVWFFKFSNTLIGALTRAYNSKVEASPNFQAAVNIQTAAKT